MRRLGRFGFLLVLFFVGLLFIVFRPILFQEQPDFTLRLLHTNDHHAHLEPIKVEERELGGIARRKTLIEQLRSHSATKGEPVLLLSAGDIFQGTLYFNQYLGKADLDFYNALQYDVVTIGHHEFDKGQQVLADFIAGATFPIISANIQTTDTSPLAGKIKPWVILTRNQQKIGIFGLTTEQTAIASNPGAGVTFTDAIAAAKKAVQELTAQGVNKIIALTHIGFTHDLELARQVAGIDVIVGGHSHTPVGNIKEAISATGVRGAIAPYPVVEKSPDRSPVLIVTDWRWGKYLGDLHVGFNQTGQLVSWKGSPHRIDSSIAPDATFQTKLNQYAIPVKALQQKIIGKSTVMIDGERANIRTTETNLGNLIADAILEKTRPNKTQLAIINSGGIRGSIPVGDITAGRVLEVLPFFNTIACLDLTGNQVKQALENGVSRVGVEEGKGQFSHVSGLRFVWNPDAPVGSRIVDIQVRDTDSSYKPIASNATYRVAINNFMMKGGDGYSILTQGKNKIDTGIDQADALIDYITAKSPINPQIEGRIIRGKQPFILMPYR
ncbi:MAG: 5'-nucleotidase C-terminal domain-containing protein [Coleofasciculaceae cyanobacterium]